MGSELRPQPGIYNGFPSCVESLMDHKLSLHHHYQGTYRLSLLSVEWLEWARALQNTEKDTVPALQSLQPKRQREDSSSDMQSRESGKFGAQPRAPEVQEPVVL